FLSKLAVKKPSHLRPGDLEPGPRWIACSLQQVVDRSRSGSSHIIRREHRAGGAIQRKYSNRLNQVLLRLAPRSASVPPGWCAGADVGRCTWITTVNCSRPWSSLASRANSRRAVAASDLVLVPGYF